MAGVSYIKGELEHMFLGQYQHSLDDKGRLTIPSAFRNALGEGAYISQGFDKNLMIMKAGYFKAVYDRLNAMNITDPSTRLLRRMFLSSAYQVDVDKAGRILMPQKSRQFLALGNEAI
jgi:MraZ protein